MPKKHSMRPKINSYLVSHDRGDMRVKIEAHDILANVPPETVVTLDLESAITVGRMLILSAVTLANSPPFASRAVEELRRELDHMRFRPNDTIFPVSVGERHVGRVRRKS